MSSRESGFGSAPCSLQEGRMNIWHKIKKLAAKGSPRINVEAPTSHVERAIVVRWGNTATTKRTPVKWREKGEDE